MHSGPRDPITIGGDVLDILRLQMSVSECDVFAYASIESDIILLIMPVTLSPTLLQIEVCMKETQKLGALISSASPVVMTFVPVSVFISAEVRTSVTLMMSSSSAAGSHSLLMSHHCHCCSVKASLLLLGIWWIILWKFQ
jgi:reversion-inducing cysteine-rich kazal motif protein